MCSLQSYMFLAHPMCQMCAQSTRHGRDNVPPLVAQHIRQFGVANFVTQLHRNTVTLAFAPAVGSRRQQRARRELPSATGRRGKVFLTLRLKVIPNKKLFG